jgi:hypothetical protein
MPSCFVMMPISTPPALVPNYAGDAEHFAHVLEHLFVPAIEKAGYTPIRPTTSGSDVIQAHIIRSIQSAELVLCDVTSLNANVFFELGIRTALNLPAIVVRDNQTSTIPFDTGIVNHHTYEGSLSAWTLPVEIDRLAQHIFSAANVANGTNALWHYFGLAKPANPSLVTNSADDKLDYALQLLKSIRSEPTNIHVASGTTTSGADIEKFVALAQSMADGLNAKFERIEVNGNDVTLDLGTFLITEELEQSILVVAPNYGVTAHIVGDSFLRVIKKQNPGAGT